MSFDENNRTLVLNTKDSSDYVLVISNAEKYKELGYTASIAAAQQQTEPSETGEEETENKAATEVALTSVILKPDSELETVPVAFLEYLSDLDVCSVTLVYADGSEKMLDKEHHSKIGSVCFSGMSIGGKILLPIKKSQKQIQKAKVAAKDRSSLIEAAKNGDEEAMETLTIEDIDLYSQISRRAMKEDLYSIIDSCFMPCGVECDQYSIIGEIKEVEKIRNIYTKEEIYRMKIESHDLEFVICINSKDLLGEPQPGRRFKGQIWMQGTLKLEPYRAKQSQK